VSSMNSPHAVALGLLGLVGAFEAEPELKRAMPGAVSLLTRAVEALTPAEESSAKSRQKIDFEGLEVSLYRDKHGRLTVDVDSSELEGEDVFEQTLVPKLTIRINESKIVLDKDGVLSEMTAMRSALETTFAFLDDVEG